jgi:Protein of unknown function (DUF3667)
MLITTCKNCNNQLNENFCGNCGQSADTHAMNFHFLWHDIQHGLFHFDKGILYTTKQLFIRPGKTIREFIEGKRVRHFRPVSYVLLLATVYGFLYKYFHINTVAEFSLNRERDRHLLDAVNNWIASHYAISTLIMVPFYALSSYLIFKKQGYNYIENFILNAYIAGQKLVMMLITFPLVLYTTGTSASKYVSGIIALADIVLVIWIYTKFFNKKSTFKAILLSILSYVLFFVIFFTFCLLIGAVFGLVMGKKALLNP